MSRLYIMKILLLFIGVVFSIKAMFLLNMRQFEQLLYVVAATAWAVWVTTAVLKDWNLPAPFGFHAGKNQLARKVYCAFVHGIFLLVVIRS